MKTMFIITAAAGTLAALAAGSFAAEQRIGQVKVEASRKANETIEGTYGGIPIHKFSFSYEVSLDDLDLTTSAGMAAAEKRINNAAEAACKEIGREAPFSKPSDEDCTKITARQAMRDLHHAVDATGKAPSK